MVMLVHRLLKQNVPVTSYLSEDLVGGEDFKRTRINGATYSMLPEIIRSVSQGA